MQKGLSIGENIRLIRELKGYSQQGLADSIGVSQKTISRIENGNTSPSIDLIEKITDCLKIDFNKLIEADKALILDQLTENCDHKPIKKEENSEITRLYRTLLSEKERYIKLLEKELEWLKNKGKS